MKKASNIPTWNYPSSGTPIYRDTTDVPSNIFRQGGFMTTPPVKPLKDYSTVPGVNKEKLEQWNSLGKQEPSNVQEAQLLAEAVGYTPHQAIIVAAQWALESGQGKKVGGDYNYFGIKSHNEGVRKRMADKYGLNLSANKPVATSEYEGGVKKPKEASFMNFENPIEAFLGHKAFLETNARYNKALTETTSPAEFAQALQQAGYATSPTYSEALGKIARPIVGKEAYGTAAATPSASTRPKTFDSVLYSGEVAQVNAGINEYHNTMAGFNKPFQEVIDVELPKKKNLPAMSLKPGSANFGQSIFTGGQTFNPPKMATQSNKKAYGGTINLFQDGGGDPPPKKLFNFTPTPEYVGYQGNVPVSESTRVANTYRPTQQEIKATKEYSKKVGDLAQDIKKESNVSQKVAMQQAEQILEANSRIQPEAKAYANTKQAQERDAYVFDEGMNARDYFRYPLQFLAGRIPTEEERIQDRIRITDPRTSRLDKFMGTVGEAVNLAPEALLNTGIGLAFAPANLSRLGMVADAVSPIGLPLKKSVKNTPKQLPGSSVDDAGLIQKYLKGLTQEPIYRGVYINDEIRNLPKFKGKTDDEILDIMGTTIPGDTGTRRKKQLNQTLNFGRDYNSALEHIGKFTDEGAISRLGNTKDLSSGQMYILKVQPDDLPFISAEQQSKLYKQHIDAWKKNNPDAGFIIGDDAKNINPELLKEFGESALFKTEGTNVISGNFPQYIGAENSKIGKLLESKKVSRQDYLDYLENKRKNNPSKQLPSSGNVDLRLWNIFNKKKTESFLPPSLNAEAELARANADALAFSQSPYNRAKLQEFRPGQDFNVTNTEALFHNDPVARERFAQLMKDEPDFLNYKNTENWQGAAEGNYGARNFGDIDDLAIVNKNKPQSKIYNAAIHETGHSRSVRLPATKEERAILDDAWKGLKEADGSSLSVLEGEAVQGELRMLLGDKLGKRVYTQKDAGEIKTALEKMIADNHPYMQNINDFNISKIIKSLNKIGLAGLVPAAIATGAAASSNEYQQGGKLSNFNYQQNTLPLQSITEAQEVELTPEEVKYYKSLGYKVEKLN